MTYPIDWIRSQFPALKRTLNGQPVVFLDGPAGSQVPESVANAVRDYMLTMNANHGGPFLTAVESDAMLDAAHETLADFFGTDDPDCVAFGGNMTTLALSLSRALATTWNEGDEIIVSELDHDANVTPWVLAAKDAGVTVRRIKLNSNDCTLCMESFREALSDRTKLVAVGYAANATGTINPIADMAQAAHEVGALMFIDAVHFAPHGLIDVSALDCDFLMASAYKFFGPHVGVMYGKRELLEQIRPYKLRPSPDDLPGRWMTGTQNHEGIAGTRAAVDYLVELGRQIAPSVSSRRELLAAAFKATTQHERTLVARLLSGLAEIPGIHIHGITDESQFSSRVSTVSITFENHSPAELCQQLGDEGVFTWAGNHYALPFTEAAGLEPGGTLRLGALHYNTLDEIERTLTTLGKLVAG